MPGRKNKVQVCTEKFILAPFERWATVADCGPALKQRQLWPRHEIPIGYGILSWTSRSRFSVRTQAPLPSPTPPRWWAGELCAARSGPAQPRKTLQVQGSRDRWLAGFAGLQVTSAGWQDPQGSSVYWIRLISCWLRARWVPDPIRSRISRTRRQLDYHLLALRSPSPDVPAQADFDTGIHRDARGF